MLSENRVLIRVKTQRLARAERLTSGWVTAQHFDYGGEAGDPARIGWTEHAGEVCDAGGGQPEQALGDLVGCSAQAFPGGRTGGVRVLVD